MLPKKYRIRLFLALMPNLFAAVSYAGDPPVVDINRRAFISALHSVTSAFAGDKEGLEKKTNRSLIVGYTQTPNLPDDLQNVVLKQVEETAVVAPFSINLPRCLECLTITAEIEDGDIFVKRGVSNSEELEKYVKKYKVTTYTTLTLSYYSDSVTLQISIYNAADHNVIFAKNYSSAIKVVPEKGFTVGLNVGTLTFKDETIDHMIGGSLSLGQYVDGLGNIGLSGGSYSNQQKNSVSLFGLFTNMNLNDMAGRYWALGYVSFTLNLGFLMIKSNSQLNATPGLQFNLGHIFNFHVRYGINKKIGTLTSKAETLKAGAIDPAKNVPSYMQIGLGIDL
jgi:hypothetical protein